MLRPATTDDAFEIARIYEPYVRETAITFEEVPPTPFEVAGRIARVLATPLPYLVAAPEGQVVAYAYATRWHERAAYRHSVETSIYVDRDHLGNGFGTRLYSALLDRLKEQGLHTAIGGIALPNAASVALHEALGFRKVAHYEQVGFKQGGWLDVGYWQKVL
ncbi:MAG: N-acetyltransferase [Deltaproteobacteria bacterium]|nr:N-acetyltransferase [Deltaproteobacteria bacterium]